jgi:hypothetical protein
MTTTHEDEECIHEMPTAWCAICNGTAAKQKLEEDKHRGMLIRSGYFPAQYAGVCGECGKHFAPGTLILRTEYRYIAECCYDKA